MTEEQKLPTLGACRGVRFEVVLNKQGKINIFRYKDGGKTINNEMTFEAFQDMIATGQLGSLLQQLAEEP